MSKQIEIYEMAAFTNNADEGSPTGVVLNAKRLSAEEMQSIAKSVTFSHTAFVSEPERDDDPVDIRFFTSSGELKNCAHATIAAHVLRFQQHAIKTDTSLKQRTQSGVQAVDIRYQQGTMTVFFKQNEIHFSNPEQADIEALLSAFRLTASELDERYPVLIASPGANRFLLGLQSTETLHALMPDFVKLNAVCHQINGIGCFAFAMESEESPAQASARMFAPAIGVDEDVINGNSSGCLGAYLLKINGGENLTLSVKQGMNVNRPGTVLVNAGYMNGKIETSVGGTATIVARRHITIASS